MTILRYLSHPEVQDDPDAPVTDWRLSQSGQGRAQDFAAHPCLSSTSRIACSTQHAAKATAGIIATQLDLEVEVYLGLHDVDRSSTGRLSAQEYAEAMESFYAKPLVSTLGWERASDAQTRIVKKAMAMAFSKPPDGDILMIGHDSIGTLLYCALADIDLEDRPTHAQEGGQVFAFNLDTDVVLHPWRSMEHIPYMVE